jgi:predicted Zn-dependent protease
MNPSDNERDEEQIRSLLAAASGDAAPPDPAFLQRLREQSTAVFQASFQRVSLRKGGRAMTVRAMLAACLAALLLAGSGLYWWLFVRDANPALARVLDNVAHTQGFHAQLVRDGTTYEVWVESPGRLRRENPDGTYEIASDGRLWRIDEKANRAASSPSPYHRDAERSELDLFALLQLPATPDAPRLDASRPVGVAEQDGGEYLVYHVEVPAEKIPLDIEALVDRRTHLLHSLQARSKRPGDDRPLSELKVLAYNPRIAAEKFVVRDTLTEDGRVGKITDLQGVVAVKAVLHQRWTPVSTHLIIKPGDWLRTDLRGANAADLRLVKRTRVILGPGTLIEVVKPDQIRLLQGELEITVPADARLELVGPEKKTITVKGTQRYRLDKEQLVAVRQEPAWLKAFKGKTTGESIGSLVARVDGRNVPLTVGQHKVTVDIRDQIARTVIEESFVNHTDVLLEGVFHFPLPPGASISGFGMWVGDKLVEADIVEKQRAREIYETILQEKRDPGLLEWTGGNIFKARVYPIFAHSEKRITITYTQLLPQKGGRYRYSYGLQSEMLQLHPLRELAIDVRVSSASPLKNVMCPSHSTRLDRTAHSAHVEFTAEEYTPTRDFEVVIEVDGKQADVALIPHRRGEDGYFMLQVTPPAGGDEERDILPDGEPLHVLVLADTSASMDARQRAAQTHFLSALAASLTPHDTINLAACDVECDWAFDKALPATSDNLATLRQFLARRTSLGWTDLDRAFASALRRCEPNTHVVYIGDGIVTTGDADPVAFTKRLHRMYDEQGKLGTFHAISPGSSHEAGVLKAIAALGGGSVRHLGGEHTPTAVAHELLGEITQPALRDLRVKFRGVRTASVYPEQLPNLPAGTQQILLGRYLPEGRDQVAEVIVTGARNGNPVRFSASVPLKDAERGNSFIPRLWARMHLDHLLEQGGSQSIHDEIIALSEEFQIITPYTSLLVLESDADRERFKVKRTFRMRDGEKFFAQGRDNANYELKQQQMKRAADWRRGMYRQVQRQLALLGRNPRYFQGQRQWEFAARSAGGGDRLGRNNLNHFGLMGGMGMMGIGGGMMGMGGGMMGTSGVLPQGEFGIDLQAKLQDVESLKDVSEASPEPAAADAPVSFDEADKDMKEDATPRAAEGDELPAVNEPIGLTMGDGEETFERKSSEFGLGRLLTRSERLRRLGWTAGLSLEVGQKLRGSPTWYLQQSQWLAGLFPDLPEASGTAKSSSSTWPPEARKLARSLLRAEQFARLTSGIDLKQQTESFDVRWGDLSSRSRQHALLSAGTWLARIESDGQAALIHWYDGRERGVFSRPLQLGRVRAGVPDDRHTLPLNLSDYSLSALDQDYASFSAVIEPRQDGRALLVLKHPSSPEQEHRMLIDTTRHVLVSIEQWQKGKRTLTTRFDDFVEVGNSWWAGKIETSDAQGRVTLRVTRTVKALGADDVKAQVNAELAGKEAVQMLRQPMRTVREAKATVAAGKASFGDHFTLLHYFAGRQQWTRAVEHLRKCEALAGGKPGIRWLRYAVLQTSRRHEELRQHLLEEGGRLAKSQPADPQDNDNLILAEQVLNHAGAILEANESLALLAQLRPIFARQPAHLQSMKRWTQLRLNALQQAGQTDEALRVQKELAHDWPRDFALQQQYAQALANAGDHAAAYAWLKAVLDPKTRWLPYEEESLRNTHIQLLEAQGRYPDVVDYLADWVKRNPESTTPYDHYLSALVRIGEIDRANTLVAQWLREGQAAGERTPAAAARLQAAISEAHRVEPRWLKALADAALVFARQDSTLSFANSILSAGQFQQSDEGQRVRKTLLAELESGLDKLTPGRIEHYLQWITAEERPDWKKIGDGLRKRWAAETDAEKKHQLGRALVQVHTRQGDAPALLAFLHAQREQGPALYRTSYAGELFQALLSQPWSAEYEDEAFLLLNKLSDADDKDERLKAQVAALYRLTDRMIDARRAAKMKAIDHPEKLSRIELQKKQEEALRQARIGFADRLRAAARKANGPLASWLTIERLHVLTVLRKDLAEVAAECWKILDAEVPKEKETTVSRTTAQQLEDMLRHRALMTLMHLATQKGADAALAARVQKHLDEGIAREADSAHFKQLKYSLLIALDRPKELEKTLREWVRADDADHHWRLSLGFVLAEQGRIPEAITLLEGIEAEDELGPTAYRTLADWYLAANRRKEHERASLAMYRTMDEWQIHRILSARLQPWQRGDRQAAPEVTQEVLFQFTALLAKASSPQQHLNLLRGYYQTTHDFRLLAGLADAVVGHTAAKVYPFLSGMQSLLAEVGDEATVDELRTHLAKVRKRLQTPVDRRALDLLESLMERRAAALKNQPAPHAEAALTALQRAFKGDWSPGEPRLMADFLAGFGAIPPGPLAKEQLRQLELLHRRQPKGSPDRLHIALRYAEALSAQRSTDQAIAVLQAALTEEQEAHNGVLPASANNALNTLVVFLEGARHYDRGEKVLLDQLAHPVHEQQRHWLTRRLYGLYHSALSSDGEVSLGSGLKLYQTLERKLRGELAGGGEEHRRQLVDQLCGIYSTAHSKKLAGVGDDLRAFALKQVGDVIKYPTSDYQSILSSVAQTMHNLLGPRDGIEVFLTQIEREPAWFRFSDQNTWGRFSWTIAQWRQEAKEPPDLDKRLLPVVLSELRRDLESRQQRSRVLYHHGTSYFWAAKEVEFAAVAEQVLARHPQSGLMAQYIAEYFYHGLYRYPRAIEVLLAAHKGQLLNDAGQSQLVIYLHAQNRHAESIPVLQPLVARQPEVLHYRVELMSAYFHTGRQADLLALLKQTDALFHEKNRWQENVMAALAGSCLDNKLYTQSVAYYNEAIPQHQRTQPRRGIGGGTLSNYYAQLARAYAGLGKTAEAVDAAGAAIVSWGPSHQNRAQAIDALKQVLREAADLDRYVLSRDNQAAGDGLDSAIVRKALGQVYLERGTPAKAIPQLQLAIGLQPNDLETHRLLTECYDKQGDKPKAILSLLQAAEHSRRDIKLYQDLGRRLEGQPKEVERAYTSIVEALPSESESHALLAEVRQQQNRWPEAVTQWQQVAHIRALEPTGLLRLAAAQIHLRQWDEARQTLRKVGSRSWPSRFGDVPNQVRELEGQINARHEK